MARKLRVKGIYGKPWSKMAGGIPISPPVLKAVGKLLVEAVQAEAREWMKAAGGFTPERQQEFIDSFDFRIRGKSTIEITSTWPMEPLMQGTGWQLRPSPNQTARIVPLKSNGTVIFRMAPLTTANAWIHPGIGKHTFIQRGIRKGREKAAKILGPEIAKALLNGDPSR